MKALTLSAPPAPSDEALTLAVLQEHSKSFALAAWLLPRAARADAAALYAWCRYADDAVDLARPGTERAALARLERELEAVYSGRAQPSATLRAFQAVVQRRGIPREYPDELLAGMRMDVEGTSYRTIDDLLLYCHRVAGVVGLMMCHVLGVSDTRALRFAAHLGIGMQLTNICRDVTEDRARGRRYLPSAWFEPEGTTAPVVRRVLELARGFYRSGARGLSALDARSAFAVRTAAWVYAAIGRELARRRYDVEAGRAVVPRWKKLVLAALSALVSLVSLPARWRRRRDPLASLPTVSFPDDILPAPGESGILR